MEKTGERCSRDNTVVAFGLARDVKSVACGATPKEESTTMSKAEMLLKKTRGATMVEYALLIIAIMFLAAIGYRNLGKSVAKNAKDSQSELDKHDQAQ
jgi:Flp pilus assembly pilin Flp